MKYSGTIVSHPFDITTAWNTPLNIGDTYFFGLRQWQGSDLQLPLALPRTITTNPKTIMIQSDYEGILSPVTEGEDVVFDIITTEPVAADTTVTYTITNGATVDNTWLLDKEVTVKDTVDMVALCVADSVDADFAATMSGTAVILSGTSSVTVTVPTVDDVTLTGGTGTYRAGTITLTSQDNTDYILQPEKSEVVVLLEDATPLPAITGEVLLSGKLHKLLSEEPIIDPDTSSQLAFSVGVNATTGENLLRSAIVDDTPLVSATYTPDIFVADDGTDITTIPVFLQAVVMGANRI